MAMQHPPPLAFIAIGIGGHRLLTEQLALLSHLDMLYHDSTEHALASVHHQRSSALRFSACAVRLSLAFPRWAVSADLMMASRT